MDHLATRADAGDILTGNEPRILDTRLAEALGYERPTNIRNLIKRHRETLDAMGTLLHREAVSVGGNGRTITVTEYHLDHAQAAFIIAKAGTKQADSLTVLMAEVFALFTEGRLVATDEGSARELEAAVERDRVRRGLDAGEEKAARAEAFRLLRRR